ncbi:MAG: FAD-dependent oxidoreductase [Rhodospirillales bacterium]|nr:FAD-dependent oxidoreductase [Rhodospirillales bacterium]
MPHLSLAHNLTFDDLYNPDGLGRIDALFLKALGDADDALCQQLKAARTNPGSLEAKEESDLLLALAPYFNDFVGELFGIGSEVQALAAGHNELAPLYACKRLFVQRRASRAHKAEEAAGFDGAMLRQELTPLIGGSFDQLSFSTTVMNWLEDADANETALGLATQYAAWALHTAEGRALHKDDILFREPGKVDHYSLVSAEPAKVGPADMLEFPLSRQEHREGFGLCDHGTDLIGALDEMNYCVICHDRGKDSCSKGIRDKKTGAFTKNPLGVTLAGCPLEEKISEMHKAKMDGLVIGALSIIAVDNPLAAGTGHRICNDCMKACIYQKQDPVDIPQAETRILKDVLALPWGFEIYGLMTRWNPLNIRRPLPLPDSGYKVLVVGLGPAGFSLAHFLMNEGHTVTAVDGLKIEPLDADLSGVTPTGERVPFRPIHEVSEFYESLDDRVMAGFGGVAEYGITVRWDKNFLKVIRLLLERRARFSMFGGVRLGGTLTADQAFDLGFDHVALCMGAGKPTYLDIPGGLSRGVRQASDFLMALQLTGAAKMESVANLQIRLPVVVIGGGLTGVDTATEALAYYVRQVEKFLFRYETLIGEKGEDAVRATWSEEEAGVADEFLAHAKAIRAERQAAAKDGRDPDLISLLNSWGGSTLAYRRRMVDSPSYTLNHEEIVKAMEQGMRFAELLAPLAVETDENGATKEIRLGIQEMVDGRPTPTGEEITLPARTVLIAAGTQPNTVLAREHPGFAKIDGKFFQAYDETGNPASPERVCKPDQVQVIMDLRGDGRAMSFFGDLHPSFAGNVVKAFGSAKLGYPVINRMLEKNAPTSVTPAALSAQLNDRLRARVHEVKRLTPTIIEVIVRAPQAASNFHPGQFYRLQNFETLAPQVDGTRLAMEGVALTGAWVDKDKGLVSLIVLEMGGSSSLCEMLKPDEPVILMGPTGAPTEIPSGETVLLAGGGLGNAVLFSIGQAMRQAGSKVLYFAAYKGTGDRYHIDNIKAAADTVIWCCDQAPGFEPDRDGDKAFVGNVVQAMTAYAKGELGETDISLGEVDRIIAIGSDLMMNAVGQARHAVLAEFLKPDHIGIGSINSPMQCMMKEICAQCLQLHRDPKTGEESVVFSCFNQDQPLDKVVFSSLRQRLNQNSVHEKLTHHWIARCLDRLEKSA